LKILKGISYFFIAVTLIYVVLCFVGPSKFEASESITIEQSPKVVFDYVSNFRTWKEWDPWNSQDSTIEMVIEKPIGVGHKYAWTSENMGSGSQEVVDFRSPEYIKSALRLADWEGVSHTEFIFAPEGAATNVTWTMDGSEIPFLARGVMFILNQVEHLKNDYRNGLAALKEKLEAGAGISISVSDSQIKNMLVVGKRVQVNPVELNEVFYDAAMAEIATAIAAAGKTISGPPLAIVYSYTDDLMDTEIAFPVAESFEVPAPFSLTTIPGGRAMITEHNGPYETSGATWGQMERVVELHDLNIRFAPFEIYVVNPGDTPDSTQFVTRIIYPVD